MQYVLLIYGLIDYARGKILLEEFLLFEQYTGILNAQMMAFITYLNNYKKKIVVEQKMESMLLAIEQYGEKEKDEIKKSRCLKNICFSQFILQNYFVRLASRFASSSAIALGSLSPN